jgi:hypothetical protein
MRHSDAGAKPPRQLARLPRLLRWHSAVHDIGCWLDLRTHPESALAPAKAALAKSITPANIAIGRI